MFLEGNLEPTQKPVDICIQYRRSIWDHGGGSCYKDYTVNLHLTELAFEKESHHFNKTPSCNFWRIFFQIDKLGPYVELYTLNIYLRVICRTFYINTISWDILSSTNLPPGRCNPTPFVWNSDCGRCVDYFNTWTVWAHQHGN